MDTTDERRFKIKFKDRWIAYEPRREVKQTRELGSNEERSAVTTMKVRESKNQRREMKW